MRTLLLADENVTVQRVIALTFAQQDIRVVSVADGQQAMEKMAAQKPDIVLAGTTLPQVSGYDLARFMRSKPELKDVPVLLLSGAFEAVDDARLSESGANGILEKPVEPTAVIGRVKELLGMKSDEKPAVPAGRLVTPARPNASPDKKLPASQMPRAVTTMKATTPAEEPASSGNDLDNLDAAFDTLDQHLSGKVPVSRPRNPSGPLGQSAQSGDPRSPGPRSGMPPTAPGNPVYEVDDDWFGDTESKARADARAGRREIAEDLRSPELQTPQRPKNENPIYEVDDEWFAEDEKARAAKAAEQQQLAAEMGIYDVDLPERTGDQKAAAGSDLDFDFLDAFKGNSAKKPQTVAEPQPVKAETPKPEAVKVEPPKPIAAAPTPVNPGSPMAALPKVEAPKAEPPTIEPPKIEPVRVEAPAPAPIPARVTSAAVPTAEAKPKPEPPMPTAIAPMPAAPKSPVADDFSALLAFEQGERKAPPMPPPPEVRIVTPEITPAMLEQIASKVAEQLTASTFGEQLRNAMTATMRDAVDQTVAATVRPVVAETAERVVREVVAQATERAVPDAVSQTTERVVRELVPQTTERVVRELVPQTTERVVREVVPETADRVVRDVLFQATERALPDAVKETTERVVRDVVPQTTERVVREVIAETSARAVREAVSETSERLVRDEIERIKSKKS